MATSTALRSSRRLAFSAEAAKRAPAIESRQDVYPLEADRFEDLNFETKRFLILATPDPDNMTDEELEDYWNKILVRSLSCQYGGKRQASGIDDVAVMRRMMEIGRKKRSELPAA